MKQGTIDPKTGLLLWRIRRGRAQWLTVSVFMARREKARLSAKQWRARHGDVIRSKERQKYHADHAASIARSRAHYAKNRVAISAASGAWAKRNPNKVNAAQKRRYYSNPLTRLKVLTRSRLRRILSQRSLYKKCHTFRIIGCTPSYLRAYVEARFKPGMTWENFGSAWHIDHALPVASAKNKRELLKLCHHTNLQPLWKKENLSKSDSIPTQPELALQ